MNSDRKMDKLRAILTNNPRDFDDKCDLFSKCGAEEYKELALFALRALCKNGKFNKCRTDAKGWAAHHITKAVFEEQGIFDPYGDKEFITKAAAVCPWYVLRYTE
ncbi:MAG: hypothetical protein FWE20_09955 [Defluviitaleaceae bacterium]|nr:hypothetical protein [Defluviitaleaceae bacterium]